MVLHVSFTDGSNPWVSLPTDRKQIAKLWRKWKKYHPETARLVAIEGKSICYEHPDGNGYCVIPHTHRQTTPRSYKTLGHALAYMERSNNAT